MPSILTPEELDLDLQHVLTAAASYNVDQHALLSVLYATGCREGEVLSRDRWTPGHTGEWILQPQKGNPTRVVPEVDLPDRFVRWISSSGFPSQLSSLMSLRRIVDQFSAYPLLLCGHKQISSHRFRHNRIKQLAIDGLTIPEIKTFMGLTSTDTVTGYISSILQY